MVIKIVFFVFFVFFIGNDAQTISKSFPELIMEPSPEFVGQTFEQIITAYPQYNIDSNGWWGNIYYINTAIPGKVVFYFHKNVCYAVQAYYSNVDSILTWNAYNSYINYIKNTLHTTSGPSVTVGNNYPYYHRWWGDTYTIDGGGAVMFDASNIKYQEYSNDGKLYYYTWISMFSNVAPNSDYAPLNKPKLKF